MAEEMQSIHLKYGNSSIPFEYEAERFEVLVGKEPGNPLNDQELGRAFDSPLDAPPLEDTIDPGEKVLIAVPDATREVGAGQIVNLLVRRLIANGTMPYDISVIFATGLHRPVTAQEKTKILTPFIIQRVKTLDHDPNDLMGHVKLGKTATGLPIEINRTVAESDHVILVGGIAFHYFAGFTGGRKLICPGLASKRTIIGTHGFAFERKSGRRAEGVGSGLLDGNPVHEAFLEVVGKIPPTFAFNSETDDSGRITRLVCGDWQSSHRRACDEYASDNVALLKEKRELVIVSCGGFPHDINLVQSHKALDMAALACSEGGTIVLLAECRDGAGSEEIEKWIRLGSSESIAARLCEKYAIGGQTAWSLLGKAEKFDVRIVTTLANEFTEKAGLVKVKALAEALAGTPPSTSGYIMPSGAKILPSIQ